MRKGEEESIRRSRGNTTGPASRLEQRIAVETGKKERLDHKKPSFFCATSGRKRHSSSTVGGILASISEAAIREAIQAHLPEDGGREREGGTEGRREEREQIY